MYMGDLTFAREWGTMVGRIGDRSLMEPNRRGFITGLISLVAAPAIVRVSSLMPVRQMIEPEFGVDWEKYTSTFIWRTSLPATKWRLLNQGIEIEMNHA